jgi:fructose-1,6-bisphosphatase/inositol monophosphatase family enzyme
LNADLELAERAARAAGEILLSFYGREPAGLGSKSSATDLVSDADREAERAVRELLAAERPRDGLLAEEGSRSEAQSGRRWIVDPLDGTINFLYGFPAWAVSVALEDADGTAAGVVHSPLHGETFRAARGEGAELDGRPLRVRGAVALERAMVATGFSYEPARRAEQAEVVRALLPRVRDIRRAGAAALDLAWVAAGRVDAFYERGLKAWDRAAGDLLVREAGGAVGSLEGDPPGVIAAATPELLGELRALVS